MIARDLFELLLLEHYHYLRQLHSSTGLSRYHMNHHHQLVRLAEAVRVAGVRLQRLVAQAQSEGPSVLEASDIDRERGDGHFKV